MKIITDSEQEVVVQESKSWLGIFISLLFVAVGIFIAIQELFPSSTATTISTSGPAWVWPIAVILVGLVIFMFAWKSATIDLDKTNSRVVITRKGIFGTRQQEFAFNQITKVRVFEMVAARRTGNITRTSESFQLKLVLADGKVAPLNSRTIGVAQMLDFSQKIAGFIGVPLEQASSLLDTVVQKTGLNM